MHRLFLDANVLFSAAFTLGKLNRLWNCQAVLVTSAYAIAEAQRNLSSHRKERLSVLDALLEAVTVVPEASHRLLPSTVQLPAKDQPILAAAIQAKATHLLTGDKKHFGSYFNQRLNGVLIQPLGLYLMQNVSTA